MEVAPTLANLGDRATTPLHGSNTPLMPTRQYFLQSFRQTGRPSTRPRAGTGADPAVTGHPVRRPGGSLGVEGGPGHGAASAVRIPVRRAG